MRTMRYIASFLMLLPLLLTACMRENWPESGESAGWAIPFNTAASADVIVSTKGTMTDPASENVVYNVYVMVFDENGNKVFGVYLDHNKIGSGEDNHWEYTNSAKSAGTIHLKSSKPSEDFGTNCTIVVIANLNAEMVNITEKQLDNIGSFSALNSVAAELLQPITSRSGYFPMCGMLTGVNMYGENPSTQKKDKIEFTNGSTLILERLDAKIQFNVQVEPGEAYGIKDFTPLTWQVVNVPRYSSVMSGGNASTDASQFFDGLETNFETETLLNPITKYYDSSKEICVHGFSFYMMENKKAPKSKPDQKLDSENNPLVDSDNAPIYWEYTDRDLQQKDSNGKNVVDSNGKPVFVYANDLATYVILKGRLVIKKDGETKYAEVKYIIHLGDFGNTATSNKQGDFNILRNHSYTFNVYIRGVSDIRTEVESSKELDPGASGQIVIPVKKIFTCDSHYSTHAIDFYYKDLKQYGLGWWVKTPFSNNGYTSNNQGQLVASGDLADYEWVEFRVNGKEADANYTSNKWTGYKPRTGANADGKTLTIAELMAYFKTQMDKLDSDLEKYTGAEGDVWTSEFDHVYTNPTSGATLEEKKEYIRNNAKITVTAFVNEYYYETDPDGVTRTVQERMQVFVNQPMRTMCIMSSGEKSKDGESIVEAAAYIFQQYSIQSPYNFQNVESGWGCEYQTDARESLCNSSNKNSAYWSSTANEQRDNSDPDNGRWNTMIEWGLRTASNPAFNTNDLLKWGDYLNLTDDDDSKPLMRNDTDHNYKYLRYTCMSRNRDNNGDGIINKDEVRWYMAASDQLIGLFLGSYGIEGDACLYNVSPKERKDGKWRQHVLASNCVSGSKKSNLEVRIVWAEEGLSGSHMGNNDGSMLSVRCVRNLGYDPKGAADHNYDITYSDEGEPGNPDHKPKDLIVVTEKKIVDGKEVKYEDGWTDKDKYKYAFFDVDCSRVNDRSLRYYTDRELAWHDENSEAACLYKHFQTATIDGSITLPSAMYIDKVNEMVGGDTPYCPETYRIPNVRELGIIWYFVEQAVALKYLDGKFGYSRTHFSFGVASDNNRTGNDKHWGWGMGNQGNKPRVFMAGTANYTTASIRCVKDVKVETTSTTTP